MRRLGTLYALTIAAGAGFIAGIATGIAGRQRQRRQFGDAFTEFIDTYLEDLADACDGPALPGEDND